MNDRIFVKPAAPDMKVRKPTGPHLAEAGEWVPRESYWLRRLSDGDVVEATPPAATEEPGAAARKPR